jgi:hypothetical protein
MRAMLLIITYYTRTIIYYIIIGKRTVSTETNVYNIITIVHYKEIIRIFTLVSSSNASDTNAHTFIYSERIVVDLQT